MARVTVEDCIEKVSNRFELIVAAAQRAREIVGGHPVTVEKDNDKNPVIALREIADGNIEHEAMLEKKVEALVRGKDEREDDSEAASVDDEAAYLARHREIEAIGGLGGGFGRSEDEGFGFSSAAVFGDLGETEENGAPAPGAASAPAAAQELGEAEAEEVVAAAAALAASVADTAPAGEESASAAAAATASKTADTADTAEASEAEAPIYEDVALDSAPVSADGEVSEGTAAKAEGTDESDPSAAEATPEGGNTPEGERGGEA